MSASLAQIRAALVALVSTVPDIGVVHAFERYVREEAKFRELFVPTGIVPKQLRGWWLRRTATQRRALNMARVQVTHTWQLRGYMGLDDTHASELAFDALIEAIAAAFAADPELGGLCQTHPLNTSDPSTGIQVSDVGPVMFCGVLCHSAVLEFKTWSYQ